MLSIEELYVARFQEKIQESYKETQMQPQYELQAAKGLHKILLKIQDDSEYSNIKCLKFFATSGQPSKDTNVYFYTKASVSYKAKIKFNAFFDGIISYPHPWEMLAVYDNLCHWLARVNDKEANYIHPILMKRVVTTLDKGSNYSNYNGISSGKDLTIEWDKEALSPLLRALYSYIAALEKSGPQPKPKTIPTPPVKEISESYKLQGMLNLLRHAYANNRTYNRRQFAPDVVYGIGNGFNDVIRMNDHWADREKTGISYVAAFSAFANWLGKHNGDRFKIQNKGMTISILREENANNTWAWVRDELKKYIDNQGVTATQAQANNNNEEKLGSVSCSERPYANQYQYSPVAGINPTFDTRYEALVLKCCNQSELQLINSLRFKGTSIADIEKAFQSYRDAQFAMRQAEIRSHICPPLDIRPGALNIIGREDKEFKIPSLKEMYNKIFRKKKEKQMEPIINNITAKVKNLSPDTITKIAAVALVLLVIGKYSLVKKLLIDVKKNVQDSDSYKEIVKDGTTVVKNAKKLVGIDKAGA